jgi:hypothetical protein
VTDRYQHDSEFTDGATLTIDATSTLKVEGTLDLTGSTDTVGGLRIQSHTQVIDFSELGSGATDNIPITGFPPGVFVLAAYLEVDDPAVGEPDVAAIIGDTVDPDGLMGPVNLDTVAANTLLGAGGVFQGFAWEADQSTDGLSVTFTATELDDVTAGAWTAHVLYLLPVLATTT